MYEVNFYKKDRLVGSICFDTYDDAYEFAEILSTNYDVEINAPNNITVLL